MPDMLPVLSHWWGLQRLELCASGLDHLTPSAVAALGALLDALPSCRELGFERVLPHASAPLLPMLVSTCVEEVCLRHTHMTEADLMLWCAGDHVSRPITVVLRPFCIPGCCDDASDCLVRVRRHLAEAGSAVRLVLHRRNPASDDEY